MPDSTISPLSSSVPTTARGRRAPHTQVGRADTGARATCTLGRRLAGQRPSRRRRGVGEHARLCGRASVARGASEGSDVPGAGERGHDASTCGVEDINACGASRERVRGWCTGLAVSACCRRCVAAPARASGDGREGLVRVWRDG
jgi:hypothetical protein